MSHTTRKMRLTAMRYEAEGILSLELSASDALPLPAVEAGAHIDLHLANGMVRSYSLITPLCNTTRYVVAVLHDLNSRGGSRYIHQQLRVGDCLEVGGPRNHFRLEEKAAQTVLIGGGIGITPIFSMFARMQELGRPVHLLYCARSRRQMALTDTLSKWNTEVEWHLDEEKNTPPDLHAYLARFGPEAHFYCCGPTPMLDNFEKTCETLGFPNVHIERFSPPVPETDAPRTGAAYELVLARSNKTIQVASGEALAEVLQSCGVKVDFSCREGICGACETRVLEGTIEHRDSVLSKSERAASKTMMVCVSACTGGRLVLDL